MMEGRFADSSFNSNIVSLSADDLLYLLEKTDNNNAAVIKSIRSDIEKSKKDLPKTITDILKDFAKNTAGNVIGKIVGKIAADELYTFLDDLSKKVKEKIGDPK